MLGKDGIPFSYKYEITLLSKKQRPGLRLDFLQYVSGFRTFFTQIFGQNATKNLKMLGQFRTFSVFHKFLLQEQKTL